VGQEAKSWNSSVLYGHSADLLEDIQQWQVYQEHMMKKSKR